MFDRMTDDARKAMALSRKEAHRLGHDFIGTEHIILGLIHIKPVAALLADLDLDSNVVRKNVEERAPPRGNSVPMGQIPFTPYAKRVLELSMESAHELGHDFLAPEHIFMGVVREDRGIGGMVLREIGCSPEGVLARAIALNETLSPAFPLTPRPAWTLDRFTDDAREVMALARRRAQGFCHDFVAPEHILIALAERCGDVLAPVLKEAGADMDDLMKEVEAMEAMVLAGPLGPTHSQLPFSPRSKQVLELTFEAVYRLRHEEIGPEHVLLGLFLAREDSDSAFGAALRKISLRLEDLEKAVARVGALESENDMDPRA